MFTNPSSLNLTEKDMEFWELVLTKFITLTLLGISVFSWVEKSVKALLFMNTKSSDQKKMTLMTPWD